MAAYYSSTVFKQKKLATMENANPNNNQITDYQIYNTEAKLRTKSSNLPDLYPDLPKKKYNIIYADPPWDYNGKLQFDKSSTSKEKL